MTIITDRVLQRFNLLVEDIKRNLVLDRYAKYLNECEFYLVDDNTLKMYGNGNEYVIGLCSNMLCSARLMELSPLDFVVVLLSEVCNLKSCYFLSCLSNVNALTSNRAEFIKFISKLNLTSFKTSGKTHKEIVDGFDKYVELYGGVNKFPMEVTSSKKAKWLRYMTIDLGDNSISDVGIVCSDGEIMQFTVGSDSKRDNNIRQYHIETREILRINSVKVKDYLESKSTLDLYMD